MPFNILIIKGRDLNKSSQPELVAMTTKVLAITILSEKSKIEMSTDISIFDLSKKISTKINFDLKLMV